MSLLAKQGEIIAEMPSTPTPAQSGIATLDNGERHIPSSTRPDGSVRKEIRVRPGYRPPEDVEVYKNRTAEAWKTRGKGGVPGAEFLSPPKPKPKSKAQKREKAESSSTNDAATPEGDATDGAAEAGPFKLDPEAEKEKEAKKLSKKLRQARDLQQKKEKGDALLPEQFAKVIKINELMRQLDSMGFDTDGERKP